MADKGSPFQMDDIESAESNLLALLTEEDEFAPRELRRRAVNGVGSRDVSLAFWRLLNRGEIELTTNRTVRLAS